MGKRKEWAVRAFVAFLLLMLACTIISRGIYASRMPKAALGNAKNHTMMREINASGTIITKEEALVTVQEGLLVEKTAVVEGQKTAPGDLLFQIKTEDLENRLKQVDLQIQKTEHALAKLDAQKQTAVNRASQDLNDASDLASREVNLANNAYQEALAAKNNFPSEEDYKNAARQQDAEYQKLQDAAQKENASKKEQENFSSYQQSFDARLHDAYAKGLQELDLAITQKEQELKAAENSKNAALKQANRILEDAKAGQGQSAENPDESSSLDELKEEREELIKLKEAEGRVFCDMAGYVSRIAIKAGDRTTDTAAMVLSDASGEKLFQAVISKEEKSYISSGDKMNIAFSDSKNSKITIPIESVGELEDGSGQITGKIKDLTIELGTIGNLAIYKEIGKYSCCIPSSALYSNNGSHYVLLVEEQETILGTELIARKRKVKVLDQDEEYAALEDGSLTEEEQIVLDSDKEIQDGARIRLFEE